MNQQLKNIPFTTQVPTFDDDGKIQIKNVNNPEKHADFYYDGTDIRFNNEMGNEICVKNAKNIPMANGTNPGSVNPVSKSDDMTQEVGVDANGKLFTKEGGGGGGISIPGVVVQVGEEGTGHTILLHNTNTIQSQYGYVSLMPLPYWGVNNPAFILNDNTEVSVTQNRPYSLAVTKLKGVVVPESERFESGIIIFTNCTKITFKQNYVGMGLVAFNGERIDRDGEMTQDKTYTLTKDSIVIYETMTCLSPQSEIRIPNGVKMLKDIKVNDKILALDENGNEVIDIVKYCDSNEEKYGEETDIWTFSDGTTLKTIHPHEFFSTDEQKYKYIADFKIGEHILKEDGTKPELLKHEVEKGKARHMTLFTEKYNTYFANGVLTGNRNSIKFNKEI